MSNLKSLSSNVHVPTHVPIDFVVPQPPVVGTIANDGFESGDKTYTAPNGFRWYGITDTSPAVAHVSAALPKTGNYSVLFDFEGKADGGDSRRQLDGQIATAYNGYPEIWLSYDLFIPSNYFHRHQVDIGFGSDNNKFLAIWGGGPGSYQDSALRSGPYLIFESHITGVDGESKCHVYIGASVDGTSLGFRSLSMPYALTIGNADRGQWVNYTFHIKYETRASFDAQGGLATIPHSTGDGVIELWKTPYNTGVRQQLYNEHNLPLFATTRVAPYRDDDGFDQVYFLGAANSGFDEDTNMYIDNVIFSTEPL